MWNVFLVIVVCCFPCSWNCKLLLMSSMTHRRFWTQYTLFCLSVLPFLGLNGMQCSYWLIRKKKKGKERSMSPLFCTVSFWKSSSCWRRVAMPWNTVPCLLVASCYYCLCFPPRILFEGCNGFNLSNCLQW